MDKNKKTQLIAKKTSRKQKSNGKSTQPKYLLRLYIAGQTPRCIAALANLKKILEEHVPGQYTIKIIDLLKHPNLAKDDQILAIPTVIRKLPKPIRRAIGDFSNTERMLVGLDITPK